MDLSKLFYVFLAKQNQAYEADQDFKACRSFCFELKVLNMSEYSMPWIRCAFGNVFCQYHQLLSLDVNKHKPTFFDDGPLDW
jgi:hypothetical protein